MAITAFLNEISAAQNIHSIRGLMEEFIEEVRGITSFSYFISHYADKPGTPHVITHYPNDWVKLYQQKNYQKIDPVVQDILTTNLPFVWNYPLYMHRLTEEQANLFIDSANCGVSAGVTCPLHGMLNEFGGAIFAIESVEDFMANLYSVNQWDLMTLALVYHENARRLLIAHEPKNKRLTMREIECLMWSAKGKTAYETSIILDISEQTVKTYLKFCLEKLGTSNKPQAVAKAIIQGDLLYSDVNWSKSILF